MSILIDATPSSVEIEGVEYDINTNFRHSILFELLMQDDNYLDDEKVEGALALYYPVIPENKAEGIEKILWFYKGGKQEVEGSASGNEQVGSVKEIYSYEHDDDYIYSAFLDQYGIDLHDIEDLHWWKFKAMFKSLKEDNKISKIMGYRAITINNDMSDADKKFYKEMKNIYALPDLRTEEEKQADFDNALSSMI